MWWHAEWWTQICQISSNRVSLYVSVPHGSWFMKAVLLARLLAIQAVFVLRLCLWFAGFLIGYGDYTLRLLPHWQCQI